MMKEVLDQMVSKERVLFLNGNTKRDIIEELVGVIADSPKVNNQQELLSSLWEREEIMSTGIGYGIAVPHVKIKSVSDTVIAVGIHKEGVDWGTIVDDQLVQIVVLIAAPDYMTKEYLKLLGTVMEILKEKEVREQIISAAVLSEVKKHFSRRNSI